MGIRKHIADFICLESLFWFFIQLDFDTMEAWQKRVSLSGGVYGKKTYENRNFSSRGTSG